MSDTWQNARPIRVLVAKPGLDGHDRGALIVAQGLRDAGMEVIYTGLRQTAEQIVAAAIQEDVDCIGLSSLSGAHMSLFPDVIAGLKREQADDILLIGGGVIPQNDARELIAQGMAAVFTPGSTIAEMADFIRGHVRVSLPAIEFLAPPSHIDHIGIAVKDMALALPFYRDHLGFSIVYEEDIPEQHIHAVFLQVGQTHIELLESTSPAGPIAAFVAQKGPGIHHIAYRVDSVQEWLARASNAGYELIDTTPRNGGQGKKIAFVHPRSTHGVLTEYCQVKEV